MTQAKKYDLNAMIDFLDRIAMDHGQNDICGAIVDRLRTPSPATGSAVPASTVAQAQDGMGLFGGRRASIAHLAKNPEALEELLVLMDDIERAQNQPDDRPKITPAVAPSPVGEGQLSTHLAMLLMEWIAPHPKEDEKEMRKIGRAAAERVLAAQAPKPASAGGWRSVLCPALLYPTLSKWLDEDSTKRAAEQAAAALYDAFIAAEADTAKPIACGCDGLAKIHVRGESEHCIHYMDDDPPAADRLAQTVTDAEVETVIRMINFGAVYSVDPTPSVRAALEAFVRARESAPAQEDAAQ